MDDRTLEVTIESEVENYENEGGLYKQGILFSLLKKRKMDEI